MPVDFLFQGLGMLRGHKIPERTVIFSILALLQGLDIGFPVLPVYLGRDQAVAELDKYLDDAYIAHMKSVRIVHGKGTGALRKGVHNYLKRQKHVASFRLGEFGEGDAGVTIVEFKK